VVHTRSVWISRLSARLVSVIFVVAFAMGVPARALAGTIQGTVTDPAGQAVADAPVWLQASTGTVQDTRTNSSGEFRFDQVAVGRYQIVVTRQGFRADPLRVDVEHQDDRRLVTVRLALGALTETVTISAAQVELPLSRTPDSVSVLAGEDLQAHQIAVLSDALRLVPGLSVAQSGSPGSVTSVFPRGGESDYTLVMLDGVRLNAFGGGLDFSQLPATGIERVEVVRGPQSALFGSDAIGGVVQITTRQGGKPRGEVSLEGGSFGSTRATAGSSGSLGLWRWGGSVERLATNNWNGHAPTGVLVSNDDYTTHDLSFNVGRSLTHSDVRATFAMGHWDRGNPGPFGSNPIGAFMGIDTYSRGITDTRSASVHATHDWNGTMRQRADATWGSFETRFLSTYGLSDASTRRLTARTQFDASLNTRLGVSTGVDVQSERAGSTFITGSTDTPVPVRRLVLGYFGEARFDASSRVFIAAGARLEMIRRDQLESNLTGFVPRPAFASDTVRSLNPKASAGWMVRAPDSTHDGWTRLHVSAGTGIRPPDALEIAFTDNPRLKPERSRSVELGLEQGLGGGATTLGATGFLNSYTDLIVSVGQALQDASQYRSDNISNARARGVELSAATRARWGLAVRAGYTWLDTEVLAVNGLPGVAPPPFNTGDPLIRRPRHQGSVDLTFTRARVTAFARAGLRGRVLDVEPSYGAFGGLFSAAGYTVVDAGLTVRLWRQVDLFARSTNLLDRRYEEVLGYPALGRSVWVGVRVAASR
jgi:outer membrane cobalamin receptor